MDEKDRSWLMMKWYLEMSIESRKVWIIKEWSTICACKKSTVLPKLSELIRLNQVGFGRTVCAYTLMQLKISPDEGLTMGVK
jgi:hypothetical protein